MKEDKKRARHAAIKAAAYTVLKEKGYDGASMLSIAKTAKASNETLYRWYGDKRGLFEQLVKENAADTKELLQEAVAQRCDPIQALERIAPVFLTMLLADNAILLNRAAAADPTGELGAAISAGGRDAVQPLFDQIFQPLSSKRNTEADQLTKWFLGLLVGDLQIKRVLGVTPVPRQHDIDAQVGAAFRAFRKLIT